MVWGQHFIEGMKHRRRKGTTIKLEPSMDDSPDSHDDHLLSQVRVANLKNLSHLHGDGKTIEISDGTAQGTTPDTGFNTTENDVDNAADNRYLGDYTNLLGSMTEVSHSGSDPFDHFKRGGIAHMRCSPDGKWVAICHQHACIVYDLHSKVSVCL